MKVLNKETGKVVSLSLINPATGKEGFDGFVERLTALTPKAEISHANYHYWLAMLSKEQESINFIHAGLKRHDDSIHGLVVSDLREAATYSPIDTIHAQHAIVKRLKLGKVIERLNEDGSSSIEVTNFNDGEVSRVHSHLPKSQRPKNGQSASAKGNFTLTMPNLDDNIDFTAKINVLYDYSDKDKCVCDEDWEFPMSFSPTQEDDLLNFLHMALKNEFIRRGLANCLYVTHATR